jgi:hypothetical protein
MLRDYLGRTAEPSASDLIQMPASATNSNDRGSQVGQSGGSRLAWCGYRMDFEPTGADRLSGTVAIVSQW